jgi:3-oxoacyl-[acyl-carrier protein] reductase
MKNIQITPSINRKYQQLPDMTGKSVLINGGTRGIGYELAKLCDEQGACVFVVGRDTPENFEFPVFEINLFESDEIMDMDFEFSGIDYVFNNIGLYEKSTIMGTNIDRWKMVVDANLMSQFLLTQMALRHISDNGVIVNMASRPTLEKYHSWSTYTLCKQGVITLTKAAAEEGEYRGLHAYAICPSRVDTEFRDSVFPDEDKKTRLSPLEVATTIMWLFNKQLPNGEHYWIKKI